MSKRKICFIGYGIGRGGGGDDRNGGGDGGGIGSGGGDGDGGGYGSGGDDRSIIDYVGFQNYPILWLKLKKKL